MHINNIGWRRSPLIFACHYGTTKERNNFLTWCQDNIIDGKKWSWSTIVKGNGSDGELWGMLEIRFVDIEDAVAFKLRWA